LIAVDDRRDLVGESGPTADIVATCAQKTLTKVATE